LSGFSEIVRVNTPDSEAIERAGRIIRNGGLVVFPTSGLYGLGADPFNPEAVDRIFMIKGRSRQKPVLVLIHYESELERLVRRVTPLARKLMDRFWPGRITLVMDAAPVLPAGLVAGTGKIGVRLCGHPVGAALIKAAGCPITGTSANLSDQGGCADIAALDARIAQGVDLILDTGPLAGGSGSTVVDVSGKNPVILREGAVPAADIQAVF